MNDLDIRTDQINELALFSGIAGLSLGLHMADPRITTVCHVEIDRYCQGVLMSRMRDGSIPFAPIWDDVRTFDGRPWRGRVDIISGGFPCQDISVAGKNYNGRKAGIKEGNRSGLWFEYARVVSEIRPGLVFVENVPAILVGGIESVLASLSQMGYNAQWCHLLGGGQYEKAERFFLLAWLAEGDCKLVDEVAFQERIRTKVRSKRECERPDLHIEAFGFRYKPIPSNLGMATRISDTLDRIKCIGNSCIPQQAALAYQILTERIR